MKDWKDIADMSPEQLEQAAAHDFKALVGGDWLPDGFHTAKGMLDSGQRFFTAAFSHLDFAFGDGRHHQTVFTGAGSFGK